MKRYSQKEPTNSFVGMQRYATKLTVLTVSMIPKIEEGHFY